MPPASFLIFEPRATVGQLPRSDLQTCEPLSASSALEFAPSILPDVGPPRAIPSRRVVTQIGRPQFERRSGHARFGVTRLSCDQRNLDLRSPPYGTAGAARLR